MPLRVGWSSPRQPAGIVDMSYVAKAVRYATKMHADVINISLANSSDYDLSVAVKAALDSNIVVVLAAGNNGTPNYLASIYPDLIVVAATDQDDVVPVWSSRGPYVDLAAPGDLVPTTILARPGTDSLGLRQPSYVPDESGTSFATPIVSGAVVLMQAARKARGLKALPSRQLGEVLRYTSDDISAENPGVSGYGAGRLNMAKAVRASSRIRVTQLRNRAVAPGVALRTNDGDSLLVFPTDDGRLTFVDAHGLFELRSASMDGVPAFALAAANLGRGRGTGIFASLGGRMEGFGAGGAALPGWPVTVPFGGLTGVPVLGDLDGDGSLEIVSTGTLGRIWAWSSTGEPYPGFPLDVGPGGSVYAPLALSDLDGQPGVEIIAAQSDGRVHAFRWDGLEVSGWPVSTDDPLPAGPVVAASASQPLVVVSGSRAIHRIQKDGDLLPEVSRIGAGVSSDPALGDLDHDGIDEVIIRDASGIQAIALTGDAVPGWPVSWSSPLVGPPLVGRFAGSDTDAVIVGVGPVLRGFTGSGAPLADFLPYPAGDSYALLATRAGRNLSLIQGTAIDSTLYVYDFPSSTGEPGPDAWPIPRGNFARTGSRLYRPPMGEGDVLPPRTVSDLRACAATDSGSTLLTWSAPLDDGPTGQPIEYDIRYASAAVDLVQRFLSARRVSSARVPAVAGQPESLVVTGSPESQRYFAIRSRDASGNWSAVSSPAPREVVGPHRLALAVRRNPSTLPLSIFWQAQGFGGSGHSLRIFDISGRLLRTLALGSGSEGTVSWDGREESGARASSGVCLATLVVGPDRTTSRFVLLR